MPEKPSCDKKAACDLEFVSRKKGNVITAECVRCDFLYEVGRKDHKYRHGGPSRGHVAGGQVVQAVMHGTLPSTLNIGQVSEVVNGAMYNPGMLEHLTLPVVE